MANQENVPNGDQDIKKTKVRKAAAPVVDNVPKQKASTKKTPTPAALPNRPRSKRSTDQHEDGPPKKIQKTLDIDDTLPENAINRSAQTKTKVTKPTSTVTKPKAKITKPKTAINEVPRKRLDVYVVGTNEGGEMGLGAKGTTTEYRRPRLNPTLASAGVVQLAPGGMHCAALTNDNTILTWGVNDLGALGRDTAWDGGYVDMKAGSDAGEDGAASDSEDSESDLNPREATPTAVDGSVFPTGTTFVQLTATDSATFALTDNGLVYGWGTFRVSEHASMNGDKVSNMFGNSLAMAIAGFRLHS